MKNLNRILILIPALLVGINASAQTIRMDADKGVEDDYFKKSQSIIPIYRFFLGKDIEPYTKFGVDADTTRPWFKVKKMPDMERSVDTGYTYIYFAGADNEVNQGYILALVGNYRRSKRTVYFYIDRNNDFDLSNDGPPDSMTIKDHSKIITLSNKDIDSATYAIKLTRFRYGENVRYKNMLRDHYRKHSGNKVFTDINFCYREQRYNCIQAHYKQGSDSFSVAIKDLNVNGVYNESCIDKLHVGPYKGTIVTDNMFDMTPTIDKNAFEWNGKKYRFKAIETTGSYIEIVEDKGAVLSNKLEIGKKVPDIAYFNILNKKQNLRKFKKQEIFLYFWDKDNLSQEDTTYLGLIHREHSDKLKIVTLNHGDKPKIVRIMFYYDKIKWPIGYSTTDIARDFFVEDVCRGFYLGKNNKLKDDHISPKEMYDHLNSDINTNN